MSSGELDIKIDLSAYNTTLGKLIRSVKGVEFYSKNHYQKK